MELTSLEISKRLKELGVEQESLFYYLEVWSSNDEKGLYSEIVIRNKDEKSNKCEQWSAFTVSELGEMLPTKNKAFISPMRSDLYADTEANARGSMLIYLLENGLCQV